MPFQLESYDPEAIKEYHVTRQDIENARRYVALLQGKRSPTYHQMARGGVYGSSILLHEIVEVRILLHQDPSLLQGSRSRAVACLESNLNAHVEGLKAEYRYLWQKIKAALGETVSIGGLVRANASDQDFAFLHDSDLDLPIFQPADHEIACAQRLLAKLRAIDRSSRR